MASLAPGLRALESLDAHGGHMTRAAAALDVPQSSMSRRVHALEAALGVQLVAPRGRSVVLTTLGARLAAGVRGPLRDIERVVAETIGDADPDSGTVRFGFPLTLGDGAIPEILTAFYHQHPRVSLHLKQAHGRQLVDDLLAGELDLAVTIPPPEKLSHKVIGRQEIVAALPDGHRLAQLGVIDLADLADERFIANPPSYHLRRLTEQVCRAAGFEPLVAVEITEFSSILALLSRGLGVALLPRGMVRDGIVARPLRRPVSRDIAVVPSPAGTTAVAKTLGDFIDSAVRHPPDSQVD